MGSLNLYLRHFPDTDPARLSNEEARAELAEQIAEFLGKGGEIQNIAPEESTLAKQPVHLSHRQMIKVKKKFKFGK